MTITQKTIAKSAFAI